MDARLSWSTVNGAAGYKVYARPSDGTYSDGLDVGGLSGDSDGVVRFNFSNVAAGTVLAVSSYDAGGRESVRSNELPLAAPLPIPMVTATAVRTSTPLPIATPTLTATPLRTIVPPTATRTPLPTSTAIATSTAVPTVAATPGAPQTTAPSAVATPGTPDVPLADLTTLGTIIARVPVASGGGSRDLEVIRDGDRPPPGNWQSNRQYDTYDGANLASEDWIGYAFATPQRFRQVIFQEGRHFWNGGWFESLTVQVRQGGQWLGVDGLSVTPRYPGVNALSYETFTLTFAPMNGDAIRIYGQPGGIDDFISVGELRVLGAGAGVPPVAPETLADVTSAGTVAARVPLSTGGGNHDLEVIRDGDMPPPGNTQSSRQYDSYDGSNTASEDWIGYTYATPQRFRQVLFQEGRHFWNGGWFDTLTVQVRQNGRWVPVDGLTFTPWYPGVNALSYEKFTLSFASVTADGIRIYGRPGGGDDFVSVGELRVYAEPVTALAAADAAPAFTAASPDASIVTVAEPTAGTVDVARDSVDGAASASGTDVDVPTAPLATCGDGRRADGEACDHDDDAACPGRCRDDCTCSVVVEMPLAAWSVLDGTVAWPTFDDATAAPALAVSAPELTPADTTAAASGIVYPATQDLDLALPELAFRARAATPFELDAVVRAVDGTRYVLAYRAVDADAATGALAASDGARAVFAIGSAMAAGEVGTTYRDLAADLGAAYGVVLAAVDQIRIQGTLELFRVALSSDRARGEDTAAALALPLGGWGRRGNGTVFEHAADDALPGFTMRADSNERPLSLLRLRYPAGDATRLFPFRTVAFAVRDADAFAVEIKGVTTDGDGVELEYELDRTTELRRLRRAALPLALRPRDGSPYADVQIDVAADVDANAAGVSLAAITSVTVRGSFAVGDVQLRDPIAP